MNELYSIKEDKSTVQDFYVDVIAQACMRLGYGECKSVTIGELNNVSKDALIIAISHYTVCRLYLKGYRKILYWVQGTSPDESFMRNHSYIRKWAISAIEYVALRKAKYVFMVSKGMLDYYKRKYHKDLSYKTYIMPCYNSEIKKTLFMTPRKYDNNTFCYVGGLSVWQCFPETVDIYKKVEDAIPNSFFKVFTGDKEKAESILKDKGVKNYSVCHAAHDKLLEAIADCKYGFIVRKESPVNYVATPTKLSNYMSAGLIPIVSNTVAFFSEILGKSQYSVILDENRSIDQIIEMSQQKISADSVYEEFNKAFKKFYNTEFHIKQIQKEIQKIGLW